MMRNLFIVEDRKYTRDCFVWESPGGSTLRASGPSLLRTKGFMQPFLLLMFLEPFSLD